MPNSCSFKNFAKSKEVLCLLIILIVPCFPVYKMYESSKRGTELSLYKNRIDVKQVYVEQCVLARRRAARDIAEDPSAYARRACICLAEDAFNLMTSREYKDKMSAVVSGDNEFSSVGISFFSDAMCGGPTPYEPRK